MFSQRFRRPKSYISLPTMFRHVFSTILIQQILTFPMVPSKFLKGLLILLLAQRDPIL